MREQLIKAARMHAEGELERAKTNIEVYMQNPVGIGEHSDIVEAIQKELTTMGHAHERLEMLEKYFTYSKSNRE
tara:strand:- start:2088 stop:2309 length:222 start_codon:yes stop_codon:yes gene_type:complete